MRQRLRHALDGDWAYLAHDVLDKWPRQSPAAPAARDPAAQAARRVQSLATRGNFSKAAAAAVAAPRAPPTAADLTKLKAELNFGSTLCSAPAGPLALDDDQLRQFHRHATNRLRTADVTSSGGLACSPAGLWKPLLQTPDGPDLFTHTCLLIATGRLPLWSPPHWPPPS